LGISVGDKLPEIDFWFLGKDGPAVFSHSDLFSGKKVVLFALPGAFTPTCHLNHAPGYIEHHDTIKSKGVDEIAVVSVNDLWVMDNWGKSLKGSGKIHFLSDGNADFTKAIGMDVDQSVVGMGVRSQRYSMIVEDGVVTSLNIEEAKGQAITSGAAVILEQL